MKKILSSLLASVLCLGSALPAFAGSSPVGGSSTAPAGTGIGTIFQFTTPSGIVVYSVTLSPTIAAQLSTSITAFRNGSFGPTLQGVVNLLFPVTSPIAEGTTVSININNLGNAIAAFNRSLTPSFLGSLTPSQVAQLQTLASLLKDLREKVD